MTANDLNKQQAMVYRVIKDNPGCENDDSALIAAVWRSQGFSELYSQYGLEYALKRLTRSASIVRRKRELYNLGLISYSDKREKEVAQAYNNERERASLLANTSKPKAISWLND